MEVPAECCDDFSIQLQAYKLRTMFTHLRKIRYKKGWDSMNCIFSSEDEIRAHLRTCRQGGVTFDIMQIAKLMKPIQQIQKSKSELPATKVAPSCGKLKSKKASKVTETQGGDVCGGQIKVKSKFLVKKAAPRGRAARGRVSSRSVASIGTLLPGQLRVS